METNLNVDAKTLEMCLKAISNIGSTTYKNICTDSQYVIPWGSADWVMGIIVGCVALFFVGILLIMIKSIFE